MNLTAHQQQGLDEFEKFLFNDTEKEFILSGFSGCGKTHLSEAMLNSIQNAIKAYQLLEVHREISYEITATTNKAAQVLSDRLNKPVGTIYSSLKIRLRENYRTGKEDLDFSKCKYDRSEIIYFIDEASYLSDEMICALRQYRPNSKFIYIGDRHQLPPVGSNTAPAFDIQAPSFHLSQIIRQSSPAMRDFVLALKDDVEANKFLTPLFSHHNNQDIIFCNGSDFEQAIVQEFSRKDFKVGDAKILAYHNQTIREYTQYVRQLRGLPNIFTPNETVLVAQAIDDIPTDSIVRLISIKKAPNDKYNLETYHVELSHSATTFCYTPDIAGHEAHKKWMAQQCSRGNLHWKEYFDFKNTFIDLRDLNASTVHKAQGSTHDTIFLDMHDLNACRSEGLLRRLRYVGASRAALKVYLYA